jgi:peptide-methionine (S)-S-oxide reductase
MKHLFVWLNIFCLHFGCRPPQNSTVSNPNASVTEASNTVNLNNNNMNNKELATLGAGCFWCVEAVYQQVVGVEKVVSGYTGGQKLNPTYKEVCTGETGHAEVVQVHFDPSKVSYEQILEIFWQTHNPTTLNQQGADKGTQYRSVVYYHNDAQKASAEKLKIKAADWWEDPIVTEISAFDGTFYPAEDYHQNYYRLNADKNPYCSAVISPKLAKFKKSTQFQPLIKEEFKK